MSLTGADFTWAGESRPGLPVLRWPDGSLCEPIVLFFGYSAEIGRTVASSMLKEAYTLREWLAFLWRRRVSWDAPSDQLLRDWREAHRVAASLGFRPEGTRGPGRPPSARQVERKIALVYQFYKCMPHVECLGPDGRPPRVFVGPPGAAGTFPISSKAAVPSPFRAAAGGTRWEGGAKVGRRTFRRPPPTDEMVDRLFEHLRNRGASWSQAAPAHCTGATGLLRAERDWLIARCEALAGFRAEEIATLTLSSLAVALEEEGLRRPGQGCLSALSGDPGARRALLWRLDRISAAGRRVFGVEMTCKGQTRKVPVSVDLMRDILVVGIWAVRNAQIRLAPRRPSPPLLFLSFKTGRGLLAGSVSNLMKDACNGAGIASGGHRLRAYFGTTLALGLLEERIKLNNGAYDATVENWVLEHVAEALGHGSITTTTRHYVDVALLRLLRHVGGSNRGNATGTDRGAAP